MTMSAVIANIGDLVTGSITWMGDFMTFIEGHALVLAFVLVAFVGLGIGLIRRALAL